jgi:AraC-like DNA-binding protein
MAVPVVCLTWIIVHCLIASRVKTFPAFMAVLLVILGVSFADEILGNVYTSPAVSIVVLRTLSPLLIPSACIYLHRLKAGVERSLRHDLLLLFPIGLVTAGIVVTKMMGLDMADTLYSIVLLTEILFFFGYCTHTWATQHLSFKRVWAFCTKGQEAKLIEIQTMIALNGTTVITIKAILQEFTPYAAAPWFPVLLAGLYALIVNFWAFFALFGTKEFVGRKDVRTAFRFNYSDHDKSATSEHMILDMSQNLNAQDMSNVLGRIGTQGDIATLKEAGRLSGTPSLASTLFTAVSNSWKDQSLVSRFQHIMIDEQAFLQPGLSIGDIAERLHTNKNYISRMVNQTYNMGFPEVLNILRIDYAEQFIVNHKDMNQDEIAKACGFVSATYFNSTFKRITGYTPKVWASKGTN